MSMPTSGAWPPPAYAPAFVAYRDWDAWYAGNPDRLRAVYSARGSTTYSERPSLRTRPTQYMGGVVGAFSRWLWGAPPPTGQRDGRLHVPMPADLARTVSQLLFSEPPTLTAENPKVQERLTQLIADGLVTMLAAASEACSALGDVYLRPVIDKEVYPDRAFLTSVHADGALPEFRWGRLVRVTFFTEAYEDNGNSCFRLLEHHEPGRITYALFEGTRDNLGRRIALTDHALGEGMALHVDEFSGQSTGLDRLAVVRVPNVGPQRLWRKDPFLRYFGRSDFDGAEQWFDALDECWTSWMRDLRLARARILVPDFMLRSNGPGKGATFDADQEVFTALNVEPGGTGQQITVSQFAIRHEEHKQTANGIFELIMRHAGLSSQTLGEEGDVAMTATEARARERLSFITRDSGANIWEVAIQDVVELLLAVEQQEFSGPEPERIEIVFGDTVSESPENTARVIQLLDAANAISEYTKIQMAHTDWDDPQIEKEIERIAGEREREAALLAPPDTPPPASDE